MQTFGKHLIFYDGKCGLCDRVVQFVLKKDTKKQFVFAPLQGKTAEEMLQDFPDSIKKADSVILVENYQEESANIFIFGKATFRILWLLGGVWTLLGWINFLPSWLYDPMYRFVAKNRHRFFRQDICVIPSKNAKNRFLE